MMIFEGKGKFFFGVFISSLCLSFGTEAGMHDPTLKSKQDWGSITTHYVEVMRQYLHSNIRALDEDGTNTPTPVPTHKYETVTLSERESSENSLVLLNNINRRIPYRNLESKNFFILEVGASSSAFRSSFSLYANYNTASIASPSISELQKSLSRKGLKYNAIVLVLNDVRLDANKDKEFIELLQSVATQTELVVCNFGTTQNLDILEDKSYTVLFSDNTTYLTQDLAAQLLFGGINASGRLSQSIGNYKQGQGESTYACRFKYTQPEEVGIASASLQKIETIVTDAIRQQAFPGCQIFAAKGGKVFYNRSFGWHTYDGSNPVQSTDLYDIASITKAAATTVVGMKLVDNGQLNLDTHIGDYLSLNGATLQYIPIRDFFTHTSGLPPSMPIGPYVRNLAAYRCYGGTDCTCKVADGIFLRSDYIDSMYTALYNRPLNARGIFRYSDANFSVLLGLFENLTRNRLDLYLDKTFYKKLGLRKICFNPLERFTRSEIIPTEFDNSFRMQLLHGNVHDETAALLGGIGGNAGLFSNANDLAVLFQMLLNQGSYGGEQYLNPSTIQLFTQTTTAAYRGIGFDRQKSGGRNGCGTLAPLSTYGHTGFTGTCVWVDPTNDLVFVFLSNRVYPYRNNRLNQLDIREKVHDAIYQSFNTFRN